jgi:hypothetical protein
MVWRIRGLQELRGDVPWTRSRRVRLLALTSVLMTPKRQTVEPKRRGSVTRHYREHQKGKETRPTQSLDLRLDRGQCPPSSM